MDTKSRLRHSTKPAVALVFMLGIAGLSHAAELSGDKTPNNVSLPGIQSGDKAIEVLGDRLPEVARAHRMEAQELRRILHEDHASKVDHRGRVFYTDTDAATLLAGTTTEGATTTPSALYPLDQTFLLHSRRGASKLIYLDFDGHTLSGTAWNANYNGGQAMLCPPWDIDGNPSVFGDSERTIIQQVWKRVAEDYSPFDVDVTTEYPGEAALTRSSTSDTAYGNRILVSPISQYFGNYGGISYLNTFDDVGDYYKPSLVFPEHLANGEKYIGEACSHECGHALGLSHDGTTTGTEYYQGQGSGQTGWAPIMGNSYYQNLTQWSKGEYANANNKQDDLTIIASYVGYRPDDVGNTDATALTLPAGSQINALGAIERNTDEDVFRFAAGAGAISISANPTDLGPDLDIQLSLYNSSGQLVASATTASTLGANISVSVPAGSYYLHVKGTGYGDPLVTGYSSYACLGQYSISGTVVAPSGGVPPTAVASATPTSGLAPLPVQFSGASSSDADGYIVSYSWDFGDSSTAQVASPSHIYSSTGTFTARLTVTDNSGMTSSATVQVTVSAPVNTPPVAVISATPTSGTGPLAVSFNGTGSYDSGGSITAYQWNFGDGTSGSGSTIQHTYQAAGSCTATLTVTDSGGSTGSTSVGISVQPPTTTSKMHVAGITIQTSSAPAGSTVTPIVTVVDSYGTAVSGALVTGSWSGSLTGSSSAYTDASGNSTLTSRRLKKSNSATFTVTSVSKTGYAYDPSSNLISSKPVSASLGLK